MEELTETNKDKRHALNIVKYVPTETASKTFWNFKGQRQGSLPPARQRKAVSCLNYNEHQALIVKKVLKKQFLNKPWFYLSGSLIPV